MNLKDALIESNQRKTKGRWKKWLMSIGIHSLLLATLIFISTSATKKVTADESKIPVFVQLAAAPPPPPPPPPPAASVSSAPHSTPKQVVTPVETPQPTFVQPREIPQEVPKVLETNASLPTDSSAGSSIESSVAGGVEGGVEGGVAGGTLGGTVGGQIGGVIGGTLGGTVGGQIGGTGDSATSGPLRVGGDVKAPIVTRRVEPEYPQVARSARISGVVIVEAIIDQNGNVNNAKVLKPLPMGLAESAVNAVRQWKFKPGTLNGRPVPVIFDLTVVFSLGGEAPKVTKVTSKQKEMPKASAPEAPPAPAPEAPTAPEPEAPAITTPDNAVPALPTPPGQ
jgi:protein TonB